MTEEETSTFLRTAGRGYDFDFKVPEEVIFYYCLKKGLVYSEALRIEAECQEKKMDVPQRSEKKKQIYTSEFKKRCKDIENEEDLLHNVCAIMQVQNERMRGRNKLFGSLFEEYKKNVLKATEVKNLSDDKAMDELYQMDIDDGDVLNEVGAFDGDTGDAVDDMMKTASIQGETDIIKEICAQKWYKNIFLNHFSEWIYGTKVLHVDEKKSGKGRHLINRQHVITVAFMSYLYENRCNEELYMEIKTKYEEYLSQWNFLQLRDCFKFCVNSKKLI